MSTTSNPSSPNGSPNGSPATGATASPRTNGSRPAAGRGPFHYSTRFKIVAAAVLVVVAVLGVVAYRMAAESADDSVASSGGTREFVERLLPADDSQILQQGTVGIDLVTGWTGELTIEGVAIPATDLDSGQDATGDTVSSGLERVTFTPGPGKVLESLPRGPVCAQAIVWERAAGRDSSQRTVSWCFEVL